MTINGLTGGAGPLISDANKEVDSTAYITATYGGTGTSTAPNAGQVLYSANGTTYAPTNATSLPGTYAVGNTASRPDPASVGQIYSNTQTGYIEVYTSSGWSQLGVIPITPSTPTAADVGTNITYGSGAIDVSFTPSSSGGLASSFTATSSPGSITGSSSTSPVRVTGLTLGTAYTFTVIATNGYGNATATSPSNSVTTTSKPQAPTIGTPTSNNVSGQISVPFTAGATGGKAISSYTVTSSPGNITASGASSPIVVSGLTNGTSYTFTATATNANGTSAASSSSTSATPMVPTSSVQFVVVGGGGGSSSSGGGGGGYRSSVVGEISGGGAAVESALAVSSGTTYTVTIGAGGSGNANGVGVASNGGNSAFGSITSLGGGGGGGQSNGASGGSGGGAHSGPGSGASASGGAGTAGQGYRGANATGSYQQTGGGGAGGAGQDSSGTQYPSSPGVGTAISGSTNYYAGGGNILRPSSWDRAGAGNLVGDGTNGVANTGGGAGCVAGSSGGSGIVIIRYPITNSPATATTGSPSITATATHRVYRWTANGSITF